MNGHTRYLHDGRARNLMEAILWHGGEAESSKDFILKLDVRDRAHLLNFLKSL
ncbi:PF06537 domain protein [Leptospira interrogans serovar Copenhageni str. LT2050]|uniref:PF06537 domain protein n=2 Tax=Leptospira interrogans TaxID=173 RepID=M6HZJ8_LEPIR|nr:PF06537 domain protein [Leptospira interrogans serovar Copenhageni str. LT2050]EMM96341.1 PF06537 domain protein [Leptospira interrogans serovar Zanoni str. LT2156]